MSETDRPVGPLGEKETLSDFGPVYTVDSTDTHHRIMLTMPKRFAFRATLDMIEDGSLCRPHRVKWHAGQDDDASVMCMCIDAEGKAEIPAPTVTDIPSGLAITLEDDGTCWLTTIPCDPGTLEFVKAVRAEGDRFTTVELKVRHGK